MEQAVEDDRIERIFADRLAVTYVGTSRRLVVADIIPVLPTLATTDHQAGIAPGMAAGRDSAQQNGRVCRARCCHTRSRFGADCGDACHDIRLDDFRAFDDDLVREARHDAPVVARAVSVATRIMFPGEDPVDIAVMKLAAAQRVAVLFQILGDRAGAHGLAGQPDMGQLHDEPNDRRFAFSHGQLLALLAPVDGRHIGSIAKRNGAAVPVSGTRIAATVAAGKRRGIVGIFLVHDRDEPAHHLAVGIVAHALGDRDQPYTRFGELVLGGHLREETPREPVQRVDNDDVYRAGRRGRQRDHPVELLALKLPPGHVQLFEHLGDRDPVAFAQRAAGRLLRCAGGVVAALVVVTHPQVDKGASRVGHGGSFPGWIGPFREEVGERVTEMLQDQISFARQEQKAFGDVRPRQP